MRLFRNRLEASHELARHLAFLKADNPIVLGLANGGVPVAQVIAETLDAPLDVMLVEHLSSPKHPDHVAGAVDEHGRISMIRSSARWHHVTSQELVAPARQAFRNLQRKRGRIRELLPESDVRGRTVIIASEGVMTGARMLGAVSSVRDRGATKVVVGAPVGGGDAAWALHEAAQLVVIPHRPAKFKGIESIFETYTPVTDEIVLDIVRQWVRSHPVQSTGVRTLSIKMTNEAGNLVCCELDLPPGTTRGSGPYPTVIFAHGYESDGHSSRTVPISRRVAKRDMIGVRIDFSGHGRSEGELEDATPELMAKELAMVTNAIADLKEVDAERLGMVGSGSGAQLVLNHAEADPRVRTVVVRGPMQGDEIARAKSVDAPTLLVYAARETELGEKKRQYGDLLPSTHHILEVPDATRLFNDSISLEMMVNASVDWLCDHLPCTPLRTNGTSSPSA